jgi:hypothetical protein
MRVTHLSYLPQASLSHRLTQEDLQGTIIEEYEVMSVTKSAPWYHRNKYTVGNSCEHCDGVMQHESWCITRNPKVMYAYEVVLDAKKLTLVDELSLHA